MQVNLAALGGGRIETLTAECREALQRADLILGAERLLQNLPAGCTQRRIAAVQAEDILQRIQQSNAENCCVLYSGDTGFYSGAGKLLPLLEKAGFSARIFPGISSVQLLSAKLGQPWQDWRLVSAHGVSCNAVAEVMQGKTFFLTGGKMTPKSLCGQLKEAGLGGLKVIVGERLSYPEEKILCGTAAEFAEQDFVALSVLLAEAAPKGNYRGTGLPDDVFIRGNVPMTKREVRAAILAKLAVQPGDIVWDIGAGTGSVSIELSFLASQVYAVECQQSACDLIKENREKFRVWNLTMREGKAPAALEGLPVPQAVFIGGTKGKMEEIIRLALEKNPNVRICISAIALETLTMAIDALRKQGIIPFVTQISVSKTKAAGELHLFMANNPVFLITGGCHE